MKTVFEKSQKRQRAFSLPKADKAWLSMEPPPELLRKDPLLLPEISEIDLTRHFSQLAQRNMGIDTNFYPLGSCTMKLNPRINEVCAQLPGFVKTHPLAPDDSVQGNLEIIFDLLQILCSLCGFQAGSLAPNAGAQGEFAGILMIDAYHRKRGDFDRKEILVPDSAHGTNPATAAMVGFKIVPIRTDKHGDMDIKHLQESVSNKTAGLMLTNPNTLGLFSQSILSFAKIVHAAGGLLYYDGANLNPMLNVVKPGAMGFDVMHINLHKTFSTPHGGGGPGSGPILCNEKLAEFLPVPKVYKTDAGYSVAWSDRGSIGQIASFHGNFLIYLRAYVYAKLHGNYGLRRIAENAVVNANYLKKRLGQLVTVPFAQPCMHEFVLQVDGFLERGVKALDIAKRMLDYGVHAPTIYFPQIIRECMLVEPTESESKATLDEFVEIFRKICDECESDAEIVKGAPHKMSVKRIDEVLAARKPIVKHVCRDYD